MAPITDTKEVLKFGFAIVKAFQAARADGVIDLRDLGLVFPLIQEAGPALAGIQNVPKELSDLDDAEFDELLDLGKLEFPLVIEDAALRIKVEKGYKLGLALAEMISVL